MTDDTVGEAHLIEYFEFIGVGWERHPTIGGMNPDFAVDVAGQCVVSEVYEPELRLTGRVGTFDSVGKLRAAFEGRKRKQARATARAGLPYLLVIGSANSSITYDDHAVTGAMFGRVGVTWQVDTGTGEPLTEPRLAHLDGAKTQPTMNTGISAVALLRTFNPTLRRLQEAWAAADPPATRPRWPNSTFEERVEFLERRQRIADDVAAHGEFDAGAQCSRLIIYRNPWARNPIPMAFGGPYDDHFGLMEVVNDEVRVGLVAQGVRRVLVPGPGVDDG